MQIIKEDFVVPSSSPVSLGVYLLVWSVVVIDVVVTVACLCFFPSFLFRKLAKQGLFVSSVVAAAVGFISLRVSFFA